MLLEKLAKALWTISNPIFGKSFC